MTEHSEFDVVSNPPIVIDLGTDTSRFGIAGDELPKIQFPTIVGRPKNPGVLASPFFVGEHALQRRAILRLRYPVEHGIVVNWADCEIVLCHGIESLKESASLDSDFLHARPVFALEPPLNPPANREKMGSILMENLQVPAACITTGEPLGLLAHTVEYGTFVNRDDPSFLSSGVVVSLGDGAIHVVPIIRGRVLTTGILRMNLGGRDILNSLSMLLSERGQEFETSAGLQYLKDEAVSQVLRVSLNPQDEARLHKETAHCELELTTPDGVKWTIGSERFRAPEILFSPRLIGSSMPGLSHVTYDSFRKYSYGLPKSACSLDTFEPLENTILLIGGGANMPGIRKRLLRDLTAMNRADRAQYDVQVAFDPGTAAWRGASLAASTPGAKIWVTKAQYEEVGPSIFLPSERLRDGDWRKKFHDTPLLDVEWRLHEESWLFAFGFGVGVVVVQIPGVQLKVFRSWLREMNIC